MEKRANEMTWELRPPKSRQKMISFRVTVDELRALEREAGRRELSLSELVRISLERLVNGWPGA